MSETTPQDQAIEELEQLGLREYEAKCFVSLTRITAGTAREVSEQVDVPRTRVYEAVRSLESEGLVEIQHSSPQRFRAISISEAVEVLEKRYRDRIQSLERALEQISESSEIHCADADPEVWSLVGTDSITTRMNRLIDEAGAEVLVLVGNEAVLSDLLYERLVAADDRGLDVVVGTGSTALRDQLRESLPSALVFDSELEWLQTNRGPNSIGIGRLVLVDDTHLLASTLMQSNGATREQAVCGNGTSNSMVLTLRQILSYHLGM